LDAEADSPSVETYLLGQIDFDRCQNLQRELVEEAVERGDGQISLLLCEHPEIITVGRGGSAGDVQLDSHPVRTGRIEVRWVKRGGGCLVHAPGQLAVYPVVPLRWHGFSVGEHLRRLQSGIRRSLDELHVACHDRPIGHGLWGRTGQLVAFGVAVRHGVAYHGAFINVCPAMGLFRLVEADPLERSRMSCLTAERSRPVAMHAVRAALVRHLAEAFGCERYHLYTGHPWLQRGEEIRP
jgi:lipoyl(octanoyl) transferase